MNQARLEEQMSGSDKATSGPGVGWLLVTWGRLVVGLALAAEGGVLYAHARTQAGGPSWWVGGAAIVVGAVLSLSGLYSLYVRTRQQEVIVPDSIPARVEPSVPMLGALLVYKYQALTEEQLERALEQQRKEGKNRRRLGEILLDMGLVSSAELRAALEYQRSQARKSEAAVSEGQPQGQ